MGPDVAEQVSPQQFCTECGTPNAQGDLVRFGNAAVCANCKPLFVQRMREGAASSIGAVMYGGFWRRVAAQFVDTMVMLFMILPLYGLLVASVLLYTVVVGSQKSTPNSPVMAIVPVLLFMLVFMVVPFFYFVYFTKNGGSTPGKMLLGLKIVTASGGPIGTGRAIGRLFARGLSSAIFYIGDIMAGFDSQKRALHDRICDTRVIRIDPTLFGRRIGAFAIDSLICGIAGLTFMFLWNQAHNIPFLYLPSADQGSAGAAMAQRFLQTWKPTAIVWAFQMIYSVYFTSQKGATPGKMVAGLKVVTAKGDPIGVGRAFARYLSTLFVSGYFTLGIGLTVAAFDSQCRALEDRICGTRVIREFDSVTPSA